MKKFIALALLGSLAAALLLTPSRFMRSAHSQASSAQQNFGAQGAYYGVQGAITVAGQLGFYAGTTGNICDALAAAYTAFPNGGVFNAMGFTGVQVCPAASVTALNNALTNLNGASQTYFACNLNWSVAFFSSAAAVVNTPPAASQPAAGVFTLQPFTQWLGCGSTATSGQLNATTLHACQTATVNGKACTAPASHTFSPTSYTVVNVAAAGGNPNRSYLHIVGTGFDLQAGEPVRIDGAITNTAFVGSYTVCSINVTFTFKDTQCPANPTTTDLYVPINSGIVSVTMAGSASPNYGSPALQFTGGSCTTEPQAIVTGAGAVFQTITSQGSGCVTPPTCTVVDLTGTGAGRTCTTTVMTGTATGGTLYGEIPIIDAGPLSNQNGSVGEVVSGFTIDCGFLPSCVQMRNLVAQEHSDFSNNTLVRTIERCIDIHTAASQDQAPLNNIKCGSGVITNSAVQCLASTENMYIGDFGPHSIINFTGDWTSCAPTIAQRDGIRIDTRAWVEITQSHVENTINGILCGDSQPCMNLHINTWMGSPQNGLSLASGQYQNQNSTAIKFVSDFFSVANGYSGDYSAININKNNTGALTFTVQDNNPVGAQGSAGAAINDQITGLYVVDIGSSGCIEAFSTSSWGSNHGCSQHLYNTPSAATNANITSTTMVTAVQTINGQFGLTAANYHMYQINYTVNLVTAGTSCTGSTTVTPTLTWNDPNGGSTSKGLGAITIATNSNGTPGFIASGVQTILVKAGTAITYSTTYSLGTACSPGPTYTFNPSVTQIY